MEGLNTRGTSVPSAGGKRLNENNHIFPQIGRHKAPFFPIYWSTSIFLLFLVGVTKRRPPRPNSREFYAPVSVEVYFLFPK